jgi:hypothetical protein
MVRFIDAVAALALLVIVPIPAAGAEQAVTVAATGDAGRFDVLARGFDRSDVVSAWVTGPSDQVAFAGYHGVTGDGVASFSLTIPRHDEPGRWALTVHGLDSGAEAIGAFEVEARGPNLALAVSPGGGPAGTTFAFSADGFDPGEVVSYWLTGPTGIAYEGGRTAADVGGRVVFAYPIGAGTRPGEWAMSAYGWASDGLAVAAFTVH